MKLYNFIRSILLSLCSLLVKNKISQLNKIPWQRHGAKRKKSIEIDWKLFGRVEFKFFVVVFVIWDGLTTIIFHSFWRMNALVCTILFDLDRAFFHYSFFFFVFQLLLLLLNNAITYMTSLTQCYKACL